MNDMEKIISTLIQTQVIQALNDSPKAIEKMIQAAFEKPVDKYTGASNGYSSEKIPYIEYLIYDDLRHAARKIVSEVVQEHAVSFLNNEIRNRLTQETIAEQFSKAIGEAIKDDFRINVNFEKSTY